MENEAIDSYLKGGFIDIAITLYQQKNNIDKVVELYKSIDDYENILIMTKEGLIEVSENEKVVFFRKMFNSVIDLFHYGDCQDKENTP